MVKVFKSIMAIFLSCSMLFCNVSECFGVGGSAGQDGKDAFDYSYNTEDETEESLSRPLLSIPFENSVSEDPRQPEIEPDPVSVEAGSTSGVRAQTGSKEGSTVDESSEQISVDPGASSTTGPTYPSKPYGKDEAIVLLPKEDVILLPKANNMLWPQENIALLTKRDDEATTRAYVARRIHAADLGRSLENDIHSKVTASTQDFFLYPPKSVKELFEVKDRAEAFTYKDSMTGTDVVRSVREEAVFRYFNCCEYKVLCCKGAFQFLLLGFSIATAVIFIKNIFESKDDPDDDDFWERMGYLIAAGVSLLLVGISLKNVYYLFSKACCDCYICKPSDDGCSCCYGCGKFPHGCDCCCGADGNGCIRCVNCCDYKEDSYCLKSCPCDNGGFGCDWCGKYGIGAYGEQVYREFSTGEFKSVGYFEKFLRGLHYDFESDMLDPHNSAITYFRDILRSPSLTFKKLCGAHSMKPDKAIGLNQADGCLMIPAKAYTLLGGFGSDKYPPPAGVQDYNVWLDFIRDGVETNHDPFGFEGMEVGSLDLEGFVNHLYEKMYDRDVETVLPEFEFRVLSDKDLVGKFIFATLAFCRYALGNTGELDDFARVRLRNYFNFLLALWKVRGFERK